jgi:DHA1 family tetracycline resistance protein-like MFS transporter
VSDAKEAASPGQGRSPLAVIFTTVFMDLVGFGMIIPLLALFGSKLGASGWTLGFLAASYSIAQFFFSPLWGQVSDRWGRRPILLMSLTGSTLAYLGFAAATFYGSLPLLFVTRIFQGVFAANVSTAQAYIADVTTPAKRAGGMGLIGAAFGLGFVFGPMIGGVSLRYLGDLAPGLVAGGICALNLGLAFIRLPESLSLEIRRANQGQGLRRYDPLNLDQLRKAFLHPYLGLLLTMSFLQVTAFGMMEHVFALFFKAHLGLSDEDAGFKTGMALGFVGLIGAAIQGGLVRKLVPRYGERRLLIFGLALFTVSISLMPFGPSYASYFLILLPLAVGRSFIDPSTSALVSKAASASEQGRTLGTFQGLSSLARVVGPIVGLTAFSAHPDFPGLPFLLSGGVCLVVFFLSFVLFKRTAGLSGVDSSSAA